MPVSVEMDDVVLCGVSEELQHKVERGSHSKAFRATLMARLTDVKNPAGESWRGGKEPPEHRNLHRYSPIGWRIVPNE
jgi:hypothetical protein